MTESDDLELLIREHVEELVAAGAAKLMNTTDLSILVSNLALNCFAPELRPNITDRARTLAELYLLPEECRKRGIEVDAETVRRLSEVLRGRA